MAEVDIDKLPTYIEIPAIQKDAMAGDGPLKQVQRSKSNLDFLEKRLKTGNKLRLRKWQKPHPSIVLSKFFWMPV